MAKYLRTPNYTAAIIVVHGQSEEIIARHIQSSLRLNVYIHKRSTSIQIDGLLHELETNFKNINQLKQNEHIYLNISGGIIHDFQIFTLMDMDDCSDTKKEQYKDKRLFEGYKLKDYVVPIYMYPQLEFVLHQCKITQKQISDDEKVKEYKKLFPISRQPYGSTKIDDMKNLSGIFKQNNNTNWELFIDYCIEQAQKRRIIT